MRQILVYADSLSWGIAPDTRERLPFAAYEQVARELGCRFFDVGSVTRSPSDARGCRPRRTRHGRQWYSTSGSLSGGGLMPNFTATRPCFS